MTLRALLAAMALLGTGATNADVYVGIDMTKNTISGGCDQLDQVVIDLQNEGMDITGDCDEKDSGSRILLGYRFNDNLAVEAASEDFGAIDAYDRFGQSGNDVDIEARAFELSLLAGTSSQPRFYGRVGLSNWKTKAKYHFFSADPTEEEHDSESSSGSSMHYGVGLEWRWSALAVSGEYRVTQDVGDADEDGVDGADIKGLSLGLRYYF